MQLHEMLKGHWIMMVSCCIFSQHLMTTVGFAVSHAAPVQPALHRCLLSTKSNISQRADTKDIGSYLNYDQITESA